jgi:hypothetical protein
MLGDQNYKVLLLIVFAENLAQMRASVVATTLLLQTNFDIEKVKLE